MNWLELHKPKKINDFKTNITEINKATTWINNYKNDLINTKKVLLIIGDTGCGKTTLANIILKENNYDKIELNSTDVRSQRKISDFLKKALTYRNVIDMFHEGNLPIGVLLDEIDTISNLTDKGGMTEFLDILKLNEKCNLFKKSMNINLKKKPKKSKINEDNFIKLYNPIICTTNDINDKKINELKRYSEIVYLRKSPVQELVLIIDDIYNHYQQKIDDNIKIEIAEYSQFDIRRLIILLEELYYFAKNKLINKKIFEDFKKCHSSKEEDIQLIDSTRRLITDKISISQGQLYFDIDCLLTPLMIYHNSIDYIKNTDDKLNKKLDIYKNILESLCIHDRIQTNIFEFQEWDELYDISSIYGACLPNYYFNQLKNTKNDNIKIEFTSLLNKICQMYVNKKLINSANFSLGKINIDNDEMIYLTEIMSYFFDKYKDNMLNDFSETEETSEDADDTEDILQNINLKKIINNNNELILFMNKYCISIDGLENILKIEKLNKVTEKRKKKFTIKIKKDIASYLTTSSY